LADAGQFGDLSTGPPLIRLALVTSFPVLTEDHTM